MEIINIYLDSNASAAKVKEYIKKNIKVSIFSYNTTNEGDCDILFTRDIDDEDNEYIPIVVYFEGIQIPIIKNKSMTIEQLQEQAKSYSRPPSKMTIFWRKKRRIPMTEYELYKNMIIIMITFTIISGIMNYFIINLVIKEYFKHVVKF